MQTVKYDKISETLITHQLPNGLKINIVPRPNFTKSYAMFATDYGGADRRFKLGGKWIDTPAGVAHFLEHKLFDMPYGNASNVLSANGASSNAFTSSGMTAYYFEGADSLPENLRVLLDFVSTPWFSAESVQKEQGIIGQEIRMCEDNPGYVLYYNLLRCLFSFNPLRESVAGTVESIAQITDKTLFDCHKVFYNPSNMALTVIGNVEPEKVIKLAEEILPAEPGEVPERDYGEKETGLPNRKEISADMAVSAPQFLFGAAVKPEKSGRARLKQQLVGEISLMMLLGRSSPLFTGLYADGLLNGSFEYELDYTAGSAMAIAGGESRDTAALMARLHSFVQDIVANGVDPDLFEKAKKAKWGVQLRMAGSFSTLSQALVAGTFADFVPFDAFDIMEEITADDISRFFADCLTDEKLALSIVNPARIK